MTAATGTSETAANLAKAIMALPPLPATAQEILTCFGDEFIDAVQVASVVEGDAGICAKLLGLANSAYFG
ncbi:MAG: HDOD domain-containing protein, partial [Woeseiaceae bacterium]